MEENERRLNNERLYQMVDDIHKTVFRGNGQPPVMSRLSTLEANQGKISVTILLALVGVVVSVWK